MPTIDTNELLKGLGSFTFEKLGAAVVVLVLCLVVMRVILTVLRKGMTKTKIDPRLTRYIVAAAKIVCGVVIALIVAQTLGIPVTSLLALFSVLSLAVSLAVQDVLANVAGGLVILFSKPFHIGDYIECDAVGGNVAEIDLIHTKINTPNGQQVLMPNKTMASSKIENFTKLGIRRLVVDVSASYDDAVGDVRSACLAAVDKTPGVLADPKPVMIVLSYGESAINYSVRCWSSVENYWDAYFFLTEEIKTQFDARNITMTYNHLNVHIVEKVEK